MHFLGKMHFNLLRKRWEKGKFAYFQSRVNRKSREISFLERRKLKIAKITSQNAFILPRDLWKIQKNDISNPTDPTKLQFFVQRILKIAKLRKSQSQRPQKNPLSPDRKSVF